MKTKFLQPTSAQMKLKAGDVISHSLHGAGIISQEWGTWKSCRICHSENCNHKAEKVSVSGQGVFDVKFENGQNYPINRVWLQPL